MAVHNNQKNATTGLLPNQILLGMEPPLMLETEILTGNQFAEDQIALMKQWRNEAIQALQQVAETPLNF
jgi:hypothetical protein